MLLKKNFARLVLFQIFWKTISLLSQKVLLPSNLLKVEKRLRLDLELAFGSLLVLNQQRFQMLLESRKKQLEKLLNVQDLRFLTLEWKIVQTLKRIMLLELTQLQIRLQIKVQW